MKKKLHPSSVPHSKLIIENLKRDPKFAVEYLKVAIEEATDEVGQDVLLGVVRQIVEVLTSGNKLKDFSIHDVMVLLNKKYDIEIIIKPKAQDHLPGEIRVTM